MSARDLAASGLGVEDVDPEDLELADVSFGDLNDVTNESAWRPAPDMYVAAGGHIVNSFGFLVSVEPWADKDTEQTYSW